MSSEYRISSKHIARNSILASAVVAGTFFLSERGFNYIDQHSSDRGVSLDMIDNRDIVTDDLTFVAARASIDKVYPHVALGTITGLSASQDEEFGVFVDMDPQFDEDGNLVSGEMDNPKPHTNRLDINSHDALILKAVANITDKMHGDVKALFVVDEDNTSMELARNKQGQTLLVQEQKEVNPSTGETNTAQRFFYISVNHGLGGRFDAPMVISNPEFNGQYWPEGSLETVRNYSRIDE